MVTHGKKQRTILGNFYNITNTPPPETKWGKTILLYEEFAARFNRQDESIAVVVKQKNLDEFRKLIGEPKAVLAHVDEYVVVRN